MASTASDGNGLPQNSAPQYGVSQPICLRLPTENDVRLTQNLEVELAAFNVFETNEEMQRRLDVLRRINALVNNWVRIVSEQKGLPPDQVESAGGKLFTFGSYRLGVHTRGADIDSLCVAPRHVHRSDFFTSFYDMLKDDSAVTDLHAVEEAFVPVIKLRYNGIELDILFAQLALRSIPQDQSLDDDNLLRNLDEKSIRSLNGCRVADEILKSIPNQLTFTVSLRAIKIWAKNHSIYSNSLGFLGGVSWAILVARVCQLYPNACPATIVEKFFLVFAEWQWPHPVVLKDTDASPRQDIGNLNDLVWDPRNKLTDRYHLMPIITPAYPEQNSTFNVTKSTREIITNELKDGLQTVMEIVHDRADWKVLFEEVNFFSRYKYYICLVCATATEDDHLVFASLVESKIRHLITFFERNDCVKLCHINPKQFKPVPGAPLNIDYENPIATLWFIGLQLDSAMKKSIDLTKQIQQFSDLVMKAATTSNVYKSTMIVNPVYLKRGELNTWIKKTDIFHGKNYRKLGTSAAVLQQRQEAADTAVAAQTPISQQTNGVTTASGGGDVTTAAAAAASDILENAQTPAGPIIQTGSLSQPSSPAPTTSSTGMDTTEQEPGSLGSSSVNGVKRPHPMDGLSVIRRAPMQHSLSTPDLEAAATFDTRPAAQLPVEHPIASNPNGLAPSRDPKASTSTAASTTASLAPSFKRRSFLSPPSILTAAAHAAATANATPNLQPAAMSAPSSGVSSPALSTDNSSSDQPANKRAKFGYMSAPQNNHTTMPSSASATS